MAHVCKISELREKRSGGRRPENLEKSPGRRSGHFRPPQPGEFCVARIGIKSSSPPKRVQVWGGDTP